MSIPSPGGRLFVPISPFMRSKRVLATFARTPFISTVSMRNIISSYAIICRHGFMQIVSACMRGHPQRRQYRLLRCRCVAASVSLGSPLRRRTAAGRQKRKRMCVFLTLHDEVPLLPKFTLELERQGRRLDNHPPYGHIPRTCRQGSLQQLEPCIPDTISPVHPRGRATPFPRRHPNSIRLELVRI